MHLIKTKSTLYLTVLLVQIISISHINIYALENGVARTPPMAWNSWNIFYGDIDEIKIKGIADTLVSSGMRDVGYNYLNLDDNWMDSIRDANGELQPSKSRFPSGIPALVAYCKSKGIKLGLYGDRGNTTCMGINQSGGYGNYQKDAKTYAGWGAQYLKYDNCNADNNLQEQYEQISRELVATDTPIVFSICSWAFSGDWMLNAGNLWRSTGDIDDVWSRVNSPGRLSVMEIIDINADLYMYAGPGHWNDPDMLEVGNGGMTETEYRSHFSLWCIMASPLIAGNDIRTMSKATKDILINKEAIAVDQDSAGIQGQRIRKNGDLEVWVKPLRSYTGNEKAVLLFNRGSSGATISVNWDEIGLLANQGATVRDLWQHSDLGTKTGTYSTTVASHGVVMLKIIGKSKYNAPSASGYISDIEFVDIANGWGPVEKNTSVGDKASGDGKPVTVNGTTFTKGLGVHAFSNVRVKTGGVCSRFTSMIGVDDEVGSDPGTVVFEVWADYLKLYDSGTMRQGDGAKKVDLDIRGSQELTLIVTTSGDNNQYDHADWAEAKITVDQTAIQDAMVKKVYGVNGYLLESRGPAVYFNLPRQSNVLIQLIQADGRMLGSRNYSSMSAGQHLINIKKEFSSTTMQAKGMIYCTMKTGNFTKAIKLYIE
jgi:alpha-galactosidase